MYDKTTTKSAELLKRALELGARLELEFDTYSILADLALELRSIIEELRRRERKMNEKQWCADALAVQGAVNLSGIVHSWARILSEMVKAGMDTAAIWKHPANVLFASKVDSLTGASNGFLEAYAACNLLVRKED